MAHDNDKNPNPIEQFPDPPEPIIVPGLGYAIAVRIAYCSSVGECGYAASVLTANGFRDVAHCDDLRKLLRHCRARFGDSTITRSEPIGDDLQSLEIHW